MKIDYYYWGSMCPVSAEMRCLLREYKDIISIQFHDITNDFETAKKCQMYFPFLTIVNDEKRYYSPLSKEFLEMLITGVMRSEEPYVIPLGRTRKCVQIVPIKKGNYAKASFCTGGKHCTGCNEKIQMYLDIPDGIIGYMNIDGDKLLGGAEYYPSLQVPYDIIKGEDIAFITCSYMSDETYDYKSEPLHVLETYLSQQYKKVVVISDEIGTFPNGDILFFKEQGYKDEKVLYEDAYCKLHMLVKEL